MHISDLGRYKQNKLLTMSHDGCSLVVTQVGCSLQASQSIKTESMVHLLPRQGAV